LAAVKTTLTTKFCMTKEMNEAHTSEIGEVTVWVEKTQFKIYGV
jgi:metal-sulfur cluster biosynthetic enzyme